MEKKFIPKNTAITISELGEQHKFVSGNLYHRIEWADLNGTRFEKGTKVKWFNEDDDKTYRGKIEWLIIVDDGRVEISIDHPWLGRLDLDAVELDVKKKNF